MRVQTSGHKAWIFTWAQGKRRTLGSVERLTLEQAATRLGKLMRRSQGSCF
ncbi:hypothetical protein [Stenotrophomonas maltophilia]|uniref:hypothetical protein n=1 Tax=Stenotrophomonas maltophilia TaxID=40324 RepID=UPI003D2F6440